MKLEEMATTSRELANSLFSSDETPCQEMKYGKPSCIQAEEDRPLTKEEKKDGWSRRPFWAYETKRMCNGCLAYYFAERAAQVLHEMYCNGVREAARTS